MMTDMLAARDGDEVTTCSSITSSPRAFQILIGTVVVLEDYEIPSQGRKLIHVCTGAYGHGSHNNCILCV